jgi:hypothetical protein
MPGAGTDWIIKKWNEMVSAKKTKEAMLARLESEFGVEAVAKHFGEQCGP